MSSGESEAQQATPSDRAQMDATLGVGTKRQNSPITPLKDTVPSTKVKVPQDSTVVSNELGLDAMNKLTSKIDEFKTQLQRTSITVVNLTKLEKMKTVEIKQYKDKVQQLEKDISRLIKENLELNENVLKLERDRRRWNLKLTGLKEKDGECTRDIVVEILSKIAPQWAPSMETMVDTVTRLGRKEQGRIRQVIVRFTMRHHRDAFWKLSKNSKTCKELGIHFKQDFCKADRMARAAVLSMMKKARAQGHNVYYRGHVGYINGVRVEMTTKPHEDSSQMKRILQPEECSASGKANQDVKTQLSREYSHCQGKSSSSSSSCPSSLGHTSNKKVGYGAKSLENQGVATEHGKSYGFRESESSAFFPPELGKTSCNQVMRTSDGSRGGVNLASSSSSSQSACHARATWEGLYPEVQMTRHGNDVNQASPLSSPSLSYSTLVQRNFEEKGQEKQCIRTHHDSGSDFSRASSGPFPLSSSSPRSGRYGSEGQGEKGSEKPMKTHHGVGDNFSQFDSLSTPPSSPLEKRSESERQTGENRKPLMSGTEEMWKQDEKAVLCCALTDLKRIEDCTDDLGPLKPGKKHTVLIESPAFENGAKIVPFPGKHLWQPNFVKLPCMQVQSQGGFSQDSRWKQIKKQLSNLASKKTAGVRDVADTILNFNPKYNGQWSFESLGKFVKFLPKTDNFVEGLFPKIAALALTLPEEVQMAIPLLRSGHIAAITLSQAQIACLLANAFFCTFPHRNTSNSNAEYHNYPSINFNSLFGNRLERKNEKLRAIMHYFNVVTDKKTNPSGLVTFERRVLRGSDVPVWKSCTEKINKLHVTSRGCIEREGRGLLQVDFANSWIGGGVLGSGLVQEEILFLINPELIVSRLFTERLQDDECLVITGSQQFSCYSGYGDTFVWLGPYEDPLQRDRWRRLKREIVAIDAVHYRDRREQYNTIKITRELNKAYCGFKGRQNHGEPDIATGKWGCGAFNGDPQLKALIQLMAAAKAGRGLAFFTFDDRKLEDQLKRMHRLLVIMEVTVGKLFGLLQDYCLHLQRHGAHVELFDFLWKTLMGEQGEPSQRQISDRSHL